MIALVAICVVLVVATVVEYHRRAYRREQAEPDALAPVVLRGAAAPESLGFGALAPDERWSGGFVINTTTGRRAVTTDATNAHWSGGHLRDPDGRIVVDNG